MILKNTYHKLAKGSLIALASLFIFSACEKDSVNKGAVTDNSVEKKLLNEARKNASFVVSQHMRNYSADASFNFSSPDGGNTYTNGSGSVSYSDSYSGASFSSSINLNFGGSGAIEVGGESHVFDFVICGDVSTMFSDGNYNDEINYTIYYGISGDFNDPEDASISGIFNFIAYEEEFDGTIELGEDASEENSDIAQLFFAEFKDEAGFEEAFSVDGEGDGIKMYLAIDGDANVSSSSLSFSNVKMLEIDFDGDEDEVKASGNLTCN